VKLISEVDIQGFRSIRGIQLDSFADFTAFAGLNNAGKSNVLRALNAFFNGQTDVGHTLDVDADYFRPDLKKKKAKRISVAVTFSLPDHFRFRRGLEAVEQLLGGRSFTLRKTWNRGSPIPVYHLGGRELNLEERQRIDQFLQLINFRYIPNRVLPVDIVKNEHQALRDVLVRRLARKGAEHNRTFEAIRETSESLIHSLAERLTKALPDIGKVRLATPTSWADMLFAFGYRLGSEDVELEDSVQGSGVQSLLMLETLYLIDRDYFQKFGWRQAAIWAIEEPESSLHTTLEARVASYLSSIATDSSSRLQVLCTTHSDLMLQHASQAVVVRKDGSETIVEPAATPREAVEQTARAGISRWVHPLLFYPLDPIVLVEGQFDREFLEESFKYLRPNRPIHVVDLPVLDRSSGGGGVDRMRQYVKEHAAAIASRRSDAPLVVVLDWDAANRADTFSRLVRGARSYRVLAWPIDSLNPKAEASFRGIERAHSDRVLDEAIARGAAIGRKQNGNYIVQPQEYDAVKQILAEIVREGLERSDFEHARPFIEKILREADAI